MRWPSNKRVELKKERAESVLTYMRGGLALAGAIAGAAGALLLIAQRRRRRALMLATWPARAFEGFTLMMTLKDAPSRVLRAGVPASAVHVSLSAEHDRVPHASDEEIDKAWNDRLAKVRASGGKLFDASKFRLRRIGWRDGKVFMDLGLTSYKEYIGTNRALEERRRALEADGVIDCGEAAAHLSNALGSETMLVTSDGQCVLLRRSSKVQQSVGLYNGPSGHAEPAHAGLDTHAEASGKASAGAVASTWRMLEKD